MQQQFLLNPDGTVPKGTKVHLLLAAGVGRFVRPTPCPGSDYAEAEPEPGVDGILLQKWVKHADE